jgi:hypothetical protein
VEVMMGKHAHRTGRVATAALAPTALALAVLLALTAGCAGARDPATWQPAAPRIVAFGDVHGDLDATRAALRLAGAIDERDRWVGGPLVVVQTGDQLDRGPAEREILHPFERLRRDAARAGGAFHALNGNHELMNALLDLRYVTDDGFRAFSDLAPADAAADSVLALLPPEQRGRAAAFRPGGRYAMLLAGRNMILVLGDNVFVHGGVLPAHVEYGIDRINDEVRAWLRGDAPAPSWSRGADTPIWTRLYSREVGEEACTTAAQVLAALDARRMIIGHTVHRDGITAYCGGMVWAVDVGSSAYYGGPVEVLEIAGDSVRVLRDRDRMP